MVMGSSQSLYASFVRQPEVAAWEQWFVCHLHRWQCSAAGAWRCWSAICAGSVGSGIPRNLVLCTSSSPQSLSSGKTDGVISEPACTAVVWDKTRPAQHVCSGRSTDLTAPHNFIVKHHYRPFHSWSLPQVLNCWSHGNTTEFQLYVFLEEVVGFAAVNLET